MLAAAPSARASLSVHDIINDTDDERLLDAVCDAALAFLAVNAAPGHNDNTGVKASHAVPDGEAFHATHQQRADAAHDAPDALPFVCNFQQPSDGVPEPVVSIQLSENDDVVTPARSGRTRGTSIYRRVWGSGPSPILQRQIQRYSLRQQGNAGTSKVGRDQVSMGGGSPRLDGPPAARAIPSARPLQPADITHAKSPPVTSSYSRPATLRQRSSIGSATAFREAQGPKSPASHRSMTAASPPPAAVLRTPDTRPPRDVFVTPTTKGSTPGSSRAYFSATSSPGLLNQRTPPSSLRPSPATASVAGSRLSPSPWRKPAPGIQHQPRGVATLRHAAAAGTLGSPSWSGMSPCHSGTVAVLDPGMARTLEAVLLAEDLLGDLVARAVELVESGEAHAQRPAMKHKAATVAVQHRYAAALSAVAEMDKSTVDGEVDDTSQPGCRCVVM